MPSGHLGKALQNVFLLDIVQNWANLGGKISCEDGFFGLKKISLLIKQQQKKHSECKDINKKRCLLNPKVKLSPSKSIALFMLSLCIFIQFH